MSTEEIFYHEKEEDGDGKSSARAAAREADSWREREKQLKNTAKLSFGDIDYVLKDLTDEELQDLKEATLECLKPDTADFLEKSSVFTGKALRYHMANRLRGLPVG